jgi:Tfp pilus assembly protein PilN
MSTITAPSRRGASAQRVAALPQVNLLPQHVRDARRVRAARRLLGLALIGLVVLGGVGYGLAVLSRVDADNQLTIAQTDSARIAAEENKYAEVPQIRARAAEITRARQAATATEILWQPALASFAGTLPSGTTVESLTVAPIEATTSGTAADPLASTDGAAALQFTARSATVPDLAAWMDSLGAVAGFSDVRISAATKTDDTGGSYYEVQGTLQLDKALLAGRFNGTGKN